MVFKKKNCLRKKNMTSLYLLPQRFKDKLCSKFDGCRFFKYKFLWFL